MNPEKLKSQCRWATEPGACSENLLPSCGWPGRLPELSEPQVPFGRGATLRFLREFRFGGSVKVALGHWCEKVPDFSSELQASRLEGCQVWGLQGSRALNPKPLNP